MVSRVAYLIIAAVIGVLAIAACRVTQSPLADVGTAVTGPLENLVGSSAGVLSGVFGNVQNIADLRRENQKLRDDLAKARQDEALVPELQRENQRLREQLGLREANPGLKWINGRIVGMDTNNTTRSITIDVGTKDGISDGMVVISAQGLVGRVIRSGPSTAKVLLVSDTSSSVNSVVQSSRAKGVVNGSPTGLLVMRYIPQGETVKTGDRVITSGLGGMYPEGIVVGSVIDVRTKDVDLYQEARIEPAVDLEALESVLVVTNFTPVKLE